MMDRVLNSVWCPRRQRTRLRTMLRVALVVSLTALALSNTLTVQAHVQAVELTAHSLVDQTADQDSAGAPIADVPGPGQPVPHPPSQCPRTVGCQYAEQTVMPIGYRMQSLQVCGANCTSQYWVASSSDGQQLLEIDPVRGGALVAVSRASAPGGHPPVRVVMPMFAPSDPACCPSGYSDTTYTWDAASGTLVAGEPVVTPADQFPGYDAARQELGGEGWIVASV